MDSTPELGRIQFGSQQELIPGPGGLCRLFSPVFWVVLSLVLGSLLTLSRPLAFLAVYLSTLPLSLQ